MGPVEQRERLAATSPELDDTKLAVISLPRAAFACSTGVVPQVGDLLVVSIGGADRAVIVFQLDVDKAVVVDVT